MAAIYPPNGNWISQEWQQWSFKPESNAISYEFDSTAYLGLARPKFARINADNYNVFAGCIYFTKLKCLGEFQYFIKTKRNLPFQTSLSHKAIKKIRAGSFNLTKNLPINANLKQKPEGRRITEDND